MTRTTDERLATLEANEKTIFKKLDEQGGQIKDLTRLTVAVEKIATKTDAMSDKLDTIDSRITAVEAAPAEKWKKTTEAIVKAVITALVGGVIGAFLAIILK